MAVSACFLSPVLVVLPLLFNQLSLALNHFALALAKITAYCAVGCNYAVARDVGRKRVKTPQAVPEAEPRLNPGSPGSWI